MKDKTITIAKPTDDELRALDNLVDQVSEARDPTHEGDEEEQEMLNLVQALQNKLRGFSA